MDVSTASDLTTADADVVAVAVSGEPPAELGVAELLEEDGFRPDANAATLLHVDGRRIAVAGLGDEIDADALPHGGRSGRAPAARHGRLRRLAARRRAGLRRRNRPRRSSTGSCSAATTPGGAGSRRTGRRTSPGSCSSAGDGALDAATRTATIAAWANRARDLANEPPNELTPESLARRADEIAATSEHLSAESGGPDRLAELGMGAFGAVAQGSHNPAQLITLRYDPPDAGGDIVLGLVGKAVTFDTGGISLKKQLYMEDMKGDMAGGAAVLGGIGAIAELGLPLRVLVVVGATENMVGGGAYRPGDIVRAANGKTIEIVNTDAEGRLVLADALWYAREQGATHVVDFATLTGAMNSALGDLYTGVFGNDDEWRDRVSAAGNRVGDHAWSWPMHRRYRRLVDSTFADMKNASVRGQAGPVYAAEFLKEFAGEGPWAHIDMAGPGYLRWPRTDYFSVSGGTGYGVRLIAELARSLT